MEAQNYNDLAGAWPAVRSGLSRSPFAGGLKAGLKAEAHCHRPGRAYHCFNEYQG